LVSCAAANGTITTATADSNNEKSFISRFSAHRA
jgi:hypothetical protein